MATLPRLALCALSAMAVCTTGYVAYAALAEPGSPTLADALAQLFGEMRRSERIGSELDVVQQRMTAKREIAREVIARRLSLREAMAYFRNLHDGDLENLNMRGTEEAKLAENVVRWVESEGRREGSRAAEILPKLRVELEKIRRASADGENAHAEESGALH